MERHDALFGTLAVADPNQPLRFNDIVTVESRDLLDSQAGECRQGEDGSHLRRSSPNRELEILTFNRAR